MIPSVVSRAIGAVVCLVVALGIFASANSFLSSNLDFAYVGEVLGPAVGIIAGGLGGYALYVLNLLEVNINRLGVLMLFGSPVNWITFSNGTHWVPPGCRIQVVPGPAEILFWDMPGAIISAQNRNTIYFGVPGDGAPPNRLECRVIDASRYIQSPNAQKMLQTAWLTTGRLFFSLMTEAVGVNSAKMLFDDFVELPPPSQQDPQRNALLEQGLRTTMIRPGVRLFTDESVAILVANFGHLAEEAETRGLGGIQVQTPNIRQNPATDEAAATEVRRKAELANLQARIKATSALAKKMREDVGMSADLAAVLVAKADGQNVDVRHQSLNITGLSGTNTDAAGRIISEVIENGRRGNG